MAAPFLLIDGYNLMHAAGLARPTYGPGDLERCRHRLLRFLVNTLKSREKGRAKVIFDAFDAPEDASRRQSFDGLEVLFATPGSDADSLIEELIAKHSAPRQIMVISSDRRLQKAARRRRAKSVDSGAFIDMLLCRTPRDESVTLAREDDPKFEGTLSPGELNQWLDFFGDVEDVALFDLPEPAAPTADVSNAIDESAGGESSDDAEWERDEWQELLEDLGLADELAEEMRRDRESLDGGAGVDGFDEDWEDD